MKNVVVGFGKELENENDVLLGIGGTYSQVSSLSEQINLAKCLFAHQFGIAKKSGLKEAYVEVDSTGPDSDEILKWLPIKSRKIFERYRLEK